MSPKSKFKTIQHKDGRNQTFDAEGRCQCAECKSGRTACEFDNIETKENGKTNEK